MCILSESGVWGDMYVLNSINAFLPAREHGLSLDGGGTARHSATARHSGPRRWLWRDCGVTVAVAAGRLFV